MSGMGVKRRSENQIEQSKGDNEEEESDEQSDEDDDVDGE